MFICLHLYLLQVNGLSDRMVHFTINVNFLDVYGKLSTSKSCGKFCRLQKMNTGDGKKGYIFTSYSSMKCFENCRLA